MVEHQIHIDLDCGSDLRDPDRGGTSFGTFDWAPANTIPYVIDNDGPEAFGK